MTANAELVLLERLQSSQEDCMKDGQSAAAILLQDARAAIVRLAGAREALREPTQRQMDAGYQFLLSDSSKNGYGDRTDDQKIERMRGYYKAMIAAALR